jgi:hypothetical protein
VTLLLLGMLIQFLIPFAAAAVVVYLNRHLMDYLYKRKTHAKTTRSAHAPDGPAGSHGE